MGLRDWTIRRSMVDDSTVAVHAESGQVTFSGAPAAVAALALDINDAAMALLAHGMCSCHDEMQDKLRFPGSQNLAERVEALEDRMDEADRNAYAANRNHRELIGRHGKALDDQNAYWKREWAELRERTGTLEKAVKPMKSDVMVLWKRHVERQELDTRDALLGIPSDTERLDKLEKTVAQIRSKVEVYPTIESLNEFDRHVNERLGKVEDATTKVAMEQAYTRKVAGRPGIDDVWDQIGSLVGRVDALEVAAQGPQQPQEGAQSKDPIG